MFWGGGINFNYASKFIMKTFENRMITLQSLL
jgi:hypothetical protein